MPLAIFNQIKYDFSSIRFCLGAKFLYSPQDASIYHTPIVDQAALAQLLHEIGHHALNHQDYTSDIHLLEMERQAWEYAVTTLAPRYGLALTMNDAVVQDTLDSYRTWLHNRSRCPYCQAIGIQTSARQYKCLLCAGTWTVNEARNCRLMRYKNNPEA